ncbi:hypothetical protein Scep_010786 [Stephania cephalantha]|uniref:Uncharacterized protein n=1 Tax=Stephania cephalantha TaxID=152367 RepID=A0AAP0JY04_9MAGN
MVEGGGVRDVRKVVFGRMEEDRGEWEIVEEEEGGGDGGKMRLILNKGWVVGKKIMITGVKKWKNPLAARESKDESKKEENVAVEEVEERKSEGGIGNAQENEPLEKENGVVRIEEEEKKPMLEKSENGGITGDHSNVDDKKAKTEEITSDNASDAMEEGHSTVDNASDASSQGSTGPAAGRGLAGSKSGKRNRKSKTGAAATATVSSKEAYSEEKKIWEQIDALRKILGYKIAPQVNSMEEVKALYVFTGVEPSSAFKGPSDLLTSLGKLHLLMSIVGVK